MGLRWENHWHTMVYMTTMVMPPNMAMLLGKTMADHYRFRGYPIFRQIHVQRGCFDRETRRTIHLSYPHYVPIRFQLRRFTAVVLIVTPQAVDGTIHSFYSRSIYPGSPLLRLALQITGVRLDSVCPSLVPRYQRGGGSIGVHTWCIPASG